MIKCGPNSSKGSMKTPFDGPIFCGGTNPMNKGTSGRATSSVTITHLRELKDRVAVANGPPFRIISKVRRVPESTTRLQIHVKEQCPTSLPTSSDTMLWGLKFRLARCRSFVLIQIMSSCRIRMQLRLWVEGIWEETFANWNTRVTLMHSCS